MNGFKEFKYSMIIFVIVLIFNTTIITLLYWLFNIKQFPPVLSRGYWIALIIILLIITFLIEKRLMLNLNISSERKFIISASSIFVLFLIMAFLLEILSNSWMKTKSITRIEDIYTSKNTGLRIISFDIVKNPIIYSRIKKQKKPPIKYAQILFLYPFKSEKQNIFYALKFEQSLNVNSDKYETDRILKNLFLKSKDSIMKTYDFQKTKNFEYITKMSSEYEEFAEAVSSTKNEAIFLKPILGSLEKIAEHNISLYIKAIIAACLGYIVLFLLSRIQYWK